MGNLFKSSVAAAMGAAMAVTVMPSEAQAGVMSVTDKSIVGLSSPAEQAHYRRYRHRHDYRHYGHYPRHRYYRYGYDPVGAAVAGAALGLMTAPAYGYPHYGYGWGYPYGWGW